MNNNLHQINDLKAEGKYFEAGKLARKLGQSDSYGCHFGFRSTLDHARAEFSRGYHTEDTVEEQEAVSSRPWIAERTAQINADADAISDLAVGDGVSVSLWSDIEAYTIVKRTATTITLRQDFAELLNAADLRFIPGGFSAHCENQADQVYAYLPNADGHEVKITLRRWKDEEGNERRKWKRAGTRTFERGGNAYAGRRKFHDFNF